MCHLQYKNKFSQPQYRLCIVTALHPDDEGVVRTVEVSMRPRHKADIGKAYVHKDPDVIKTGIQCLAVLLPVEEQKELPQAASKAAQADLTEQGPKETRLDVSPDHRPRSRASLPSTPKIYNLHRRRSRGNKQ